MINFWILSFLQFSQAGELGEDIGAELKYVHVLESGGRQEFRAGVSCCSTLL